MEGGRIRTEYHLTEPARRTTRERNCLANEVYGLMRGIKNMCENMEVI
jgi:hypothetical protein